MVLQRLIPLLYIIVSTGSLLPVLGANATYNKLPSQGDPLPLQWHMWKQKHAKTYGYPHLIVTHIKCSASVIILTVCNCVFVQFLQRGVRETYNMGVKSTTD